MYGPLESTPYGILQPAWLQNAGINGISRGAVSHGSLSSIVPNTLLSPVGYNALYESAYHRPHQGVVNPYHIHNGNVPGMLDVFGSGVPMHGHQVNVTNATAKVVDDAQQMLNSISAKIDALEAINKERFEKLESNTSMLISKESTKLGSTDSKVVSSNASNEFASQILGNNTAGSNGKSFSSGNEKGVANNNGNERIASNPFYKYDQDQSKGFNKKRNNQNRNQQGWYNKAHSEANVGGYQKPYEPQRGEFF